MPRIAHNLRAERDLAYLAALEKAEAFREWPDLILVRGGLPDAWGWEPHSTVMASLARRGLVIRRVHGYRRPRATFALTAAGRARLSSEELT